MKFVLIIVASLTIKSGSGVVTVDGFSTMESCQAVAQSIGQVKTPSGSSDISAGAFCVEVK